MNINPHRLAIPAAIILATTAVSGCASSSPRQHQPAVSAVTGAALGAAVGVAVARNDTEGALIGGALGAALGYYVGCHQQGGCYIGGRKVADEASYDDDADRYYFEDPDTGDTYWDDGEPRSE